MDGPIPQQGWGSWITTGSGLDMFSLHFVAYFSKCHPCRVLGGSCFPGVWDFLVIHTMRGVWGSCRSFGIRQGLQRRLLWNRYREYPPVRSPVLPWEYLPPHHTHATFCYFSINLVSQGQMGIPLSLGGTCTSTVAMVFLVMYSFLNVLILSLIPHIH